MKPLIIKHFTDILKHRHLNRDPGLIIFDQPCDNVKELDLIGIIKHTFRWSEHVYVFYFKDTENLRNIVSHEEFSDCHWGNIIFLTEDNNGIISYTESEIKKLTH